MENILDVYKRSYDETHPLICMDESSKQHLKETRQPIPAKPGSVEKYDTEYERNGVSNLFMFFEPLEGKRHVVVTDHRTALDWAHQLDGDEYIAAEPIEPRWIGRIKYVTWPMSCILVRNGFH